MTVTMESPFASPPSSTVSPKGDDSPLPLEKKKHEVHQTNTFIIGFVSTYFPLPNIRPGSLIIFWTKSPSGQHYLDRVAYFFSTHIPIGSLIRRGSAINFETFRPWGRQFGQGLIFDSGK